MANESGIYNRVRRLEQALPEPRTVDPSTWPLMVLNLMTDRMVELAAEKPEDPELINTVAALKQEQARRARKGNGSGR